MRSSGRLLSHSDFPNGKPVYIAAPWILKEQNIVVQTTAEIIQDLIDETREYTDEDKKRLLRTAYIALLKVKYEPMFTRLRSMTNPKTDEEWSMVCDDITFVSVLRYVLFNRHIEVVDSRAIAGSEDFKH